MRRQILRWFAGVSVVIVASVCASDDLLPPVIPHPSPPLPFQEETLGREPPAAPADPITPPELPQVPPLRKGMTIGETHTMMETHSFVMCPSQGNCFEYLSHPDLFGAKRYVQVFFSDDSGKFDDDCPVACWKTWDYPRTK
jgi:hypothetical protein